MMRYRNGNICPACLTLYTNVIEHQKTEHHIYPKRFFKGRGGKIEMCRTCHNELEKLIPQKTQLAKERYWSILKRFFKKKNPKYKFPQLNMKDINN